MKKRQQNGNKNGAVKPFKIRPYRDPKRPHLKFVVNSTTVDATGRKQRVRTFFETRAAASGFAQKKAVELANGGLEAVQFPAALRVMALQADAMLKPYGKTILDAARHYLPILQAQNTSCTFAVLRDEISYSALVLEARCRNQTRIMFQSPRIQRRFKHDCRSGSGSGPQQSLAICFDEL